MIEQLTGQAAKAVLAKDKAPISERLAAAYALQLLKDIGPDKFELAQAMNDTPEYAAPICAMHDFCDANVSMADAFATIMARPFMPTDAESITDSDIDLWNEAQAIARAKYLTAQ